MFIKAVKKKFTFVKDLLDFSNALLLKAFCILFLVVAMALNTFKVCLLRAVFHQGHSKIFSLTLLWAEWCPP